jgi:hypothetical protein
MLNPWLSLPFQAARLGWETQTIVLGELMRIAGARTDRKPASALDTIKMAPLAEDRGGLGHTDARLEKLLLRVLPAPDRVSHARAVRRGGGVTPTQYMWQLFITCQAPSRD